VHTIEPYYSWRDYYIVAEDNNSPYFGKEYSEFLFSEKIYNYFIHPQWDGFGSDTLYLKILFVDYKIGCMIIELIGEWNDCIDNDILFFKQNIIDHFIKHQIYKFILIGENVLNFHASDDCYYEEWYNDIKEEDGWVACVNFREHIVSEMRETNLHHYVNIGEYTSWRTLKPIDFCLVIENLLQRQLGSPQDTMDISD